MKKNSLTDDQMQELLETLKQRFEKHMDRHTGLLWDQVEKKLKQNPNAVWSLSEMERTGGEPDVVLYDESSDMFHFYDCAKESPKERRSVCYDRDAREGRKKFPPENSAREMATEMGIDVLDEEQYRYLQTLGEFDLKTSSWIITPADIRKLGGSIFGDRRYNTVFVYHNGADSYYAARGFRGVLKV